VYKSIPFALTAGFALLCMPGKPEQPEFKLRADVNLVMLDVSVKDSQGGFVSNLTQDNFEVRENGKPQKIVAFNHGDDPVTVGLVLDDSGSMRMERIAVIDAALGFLGASNPQDEVFVTHCNDRVRSGLPPGVPFSDDPQLLRQSLYRNPPEGRTALYDAIVDSLHHLNEGKQSKKSLLLVSDGGDNASHRNLHDVVAAVGESLATIYTVGVFSPDDPDRNPGLLRRLASVSGGEYYPPQENGDLKVVCRQIALDIRNRYTIAYIPSDSSQRSRSIAVTATSGSQRKLIVHARKSYQFPEQREGEAQP
jgi:Ca-activated chloride channel homolog